MRGKDMFMVPPPKVDCEGCDYQKMCVFRFRLVKLLEDDKSEFYTGHDETDELVIQEVTVTGCSLRRA